MSVEDDNNEYPAPYLMYDILTNEFQYYSCNFSSICKIQFVLTGGHKNNLSTALKIILKN